VDEKYETLKSRIIKLQKLVEQGSEGEAQAAKLAIDRIVSNYGLSLDEIIEDEGVHEYTFKVNNARESELFNQIAGVVLNTYRPLIKGNRLRPEVRVVELTKFQYAEMMDMFNWHRSNMNNEYKDMLKMFVEAYINKHNLFPVNRDCATSDISNFDFEKYRKMMKLSGMMADKSYRKQLNQ